MATLAKPNKCEYKRKTPSQFSHRIIVANVVPVPKKDGKVRMCLDYRDLNRASPKDDFLIPHIDILVDNTAQHKFFPSWEDSQVTTKSK